jgi:D-serine deaminase-like pyridoxal phosphate-dependent protein
VRPATINRDALASIRAEPVDWRFKGLPASTFGAPIGEVAARGLDVFTAGFVGPLLVLDADAVESNARAMADWCAARGLALAPHGKTTMAPQLFALQLDHGAWAMTAANASQLRVYRAFGVSRVLLANQLVDPAALRWLAAELDGDPDFEFACWVDTVAGVRLMTDALTAVGASRPVDVLVELGAPGGRTGARDLDAALAVAEAVAASPALRLVGVGGYEGALAHDADPTALSIVDAYLAAMRSLTVRLAGDGHFDGVARVLVTAGGSAFFDRVAAALTEPWPDGLPVLGVLRSGAYLTHDDGFYRGISPFARSAGDTPFRPALRAWAQVTSRPEPGLALLTVGKRDVSFDEGLPEPQLVRGADREVRPLAGCRVTALNDQHAFLAVPDAAAVEVGDWVGLGLSHPCTVFDKWQLVPMVRGSTVVDLVRTYF